MLTVEINAQHNGAHRNQYTTGRAISDGWIVVPPELEAEARSYLPFIDLDIQDGVLVGVSQGTQIISPEEAAAELAAAKAARIAQSKTDLAVYLETHPLTWTDGKQYNITDQKTGWLTSKVVAATAAASIGVPYTLKWNDTGEVCQEWSLEELTALALAIDARVTALVEYQQEKEVAMNAATTLDELNAITVDYDSVQ